MTSFSRNSCRTVLVSILALLLFLHASPAATAQGSKGLLWAVETEDNTVFLLGSMHILSADSYPLAEAIEEAYRRSRVVAFETDLGAMEEPDFQTVVMRHAFLPAGESLRDRLSDDTFRLFSQYVAAAGLPVANFERFRPWMCAMTLAVLEYQRMGFTPELGVDRYFHKRAATDGKRIVPFETVDFQIELLAGLDSEDQDAVLRRTLADISLTRDMAGELARAWQSGNAELLEELTRRSFAEFPHIYEKMITRRNRDWLPQLEELLQDREDGLVVVGAAHLVGADSLPALLRAKGYRVMRR